MFRRLALAAHAATSPKHSSFAPLTVISKTPYIHQWNVGVQYEIVKNLLFEARYIGTMGKNLLVATALNQGFDLNDPNTPDHIFERFNQAYVAAGAPNGRIKCRLDGESTRPGSRFRFS